METTPGTARCDLDLEVRAADLRPPLDAATLFGRRGPVELEIGVGKGRFLLDEARLRPDTLFLGIERSQPYLRLARDRALALGLGLANVRLLRADGRDFLERVVAPASIAAIYVLFPDPWPKRRHRKRRLVNPAFAAAAARALAPGGTLDVITDDATYAAAIVEALAAAPGLEALPGSRLAPEIAPRTHFAAKLALRHRAFHGGTWVRR